MACNKSLPKGASCGRDGLHAQHFLESISGVDAAIATKNLDALTPVVNLWLQGLCPRGLAKFIASAPLIKSDNSIHCGLATISVKNCHKMSSGRHG